MQEVGGVRVREGGGGGTVPDARSELEAVVRMNDGRSRWTIDEQWTMREYKAAVQRYKVTRIRRCDRSTVLLVLVLVERPDTQSATVLMGHFNLY